METHPEPKPIHPGSNSVHRKQFFLQILLPVVLGALVTVVLGVLAASGSNDKPAVWANISTIFLACILGAVGVATLAVVAVSIYGTHWLHKKISPSSYQAQIYTVYFGHILKNIADQVVKPVVSVKSGWAGFTILFKGPKRTDKEE